LSLDRFYFGDSNWALDAKVELEGGEARHLIRVLRKKVGEEVTLFDGLGKTARAVIVETDRRTARLRIISIEESAAKVACQIRLIVALPRAGGAAEVLRKSVEAGASEIQPLIAKRSVHRPEKKDESQRQRKFLEHAITAIKQCERNLIPELLNPVRVESLSLAAGEWGVYGCVRNEAVTLRQFEKSVGGCPRRVVVVIGPEGGLDQLEEDQLSERGFQAIRCVPQVLRVETAVCAFLTHFAGATADELVQE